MNAIHSCWFLLLVSFLSFSASLVCDENIQKRLETSGVCRGDNSIPCRNVCSGEVISGRANCTRARHCCWVANECVVKRLARPVGKPISNEEKQRALRPVTSGRSLVLDSSPPPLGCATYPQSCATRPPSQNDLQPPVNIPYCQRTPCSSTGNDLLDGDLRLCTTRPGCYYDFELAFTRASAGQTLLPGVPVCYMAIRNTAFHKRAQEYISQYGPWFPPLASCILDEFSHETMANGPGCYMLNVLEYFGNKPKQAGWPGITETDCYLIDGCWRENKCVYPMDTEVMTTPSFNDNKTDIPELFLPHGQPKCQELNETASGGEFLDQYHQCLAAGCAAGVPVYRIRKEITATVFSELPLHLQYHYFKLVQNGKVEPYNWRKIVNEILADNFTSQFFGAVFPLGTKLNIPKGSTIRVVPFAFNLTATNETSSDTESAAQTSGRSFSLFQAASAPKYRGNPHYPRFGANLSTVASGRSFSPVGGTQNLPSGVNLAAITSTLSNTGFATSSQILNFFNSPLFLGTPTPVLLPCPFTSVVWANYPPLKGSFAGCCEKPLCYIPRADLALTIRSGVASYLAGWTSWSACSKSCGGGLSIRNRRCVGGKCGSTEELSRPCNTNSCTGWANWQEWGECDKSCGYGGVQKRVRVCFAGPSACSGTGEESRVCNKGQCPIYYPWGQWSACVGQCGNSGTKTRRRWCTATGLIACDDEKRLETDDCDPPCAGGGKTYKCKWEAGYGCVVYQVKNCAVSLFCRNGVREEKTTKRCNPGLCPNFG